MGISKEDYLFNLIDAEYGLSVGKYNSQNFTFRFDKYNYKILPYFICNYIYKTNKYSVGLRSNDEKLIFIEGNISSCNTQEKTLSDYDLACEFLSSFYNSETLDYLVDSELFSINLISDRDFGKNHHSTEKSKYEITFNGSKYLIDGYSLKVDIESSLYSKEEDLRISIKISGGEKIQDFYIPLPSRFL